MTLIILIVIKIVRRQPSHKSVFARLLMTLIRHGRRLTPEEAKERRRLQTRLAQRRYRGRKRGEAAPTRLEHAEEPSSRADVSLQATDRNAVEVAVSSISESSTLAEIEGENSVIIQKFLDCGDLGIFAPPSPLTSNYSPSNGSSTSDETSALSSLSGDLTSGIAPSIVIAGAKAGYIGMVLAKHNKATLFEFLSGNLLEQISSQMLRQGEKTFIPKLDFYRASFANAFALSFLPSDMGKCRMRSRITDVWNNRSPLLTVPDNMMPVQEQFTVDHDILVDILPWPSVREKALKAIQAGVLDMDTFKRDAFFGCKGDTDFEAAFQVHGASIDDDFFFNSTGAADLTMDPGSWQCSQSWLEKYWFLVDARIVRRTNWWRRMQGLPPVVIPALSIQQLPLRFVETLD